MPLTPDDIKKMASLARLSLDGQDIARYAPQLSAILQFVEQLEAVDTTGVEALSHPLELTQRLRDDVVTDTDQREKFQRLAPQTEAGLYLVPKVIE